MPEYPLISHFGGVIPNMVDIYKNNNNNNKSTINILFYSALFGVNLHPKSLLNLLQLP